MIRVGIVGFRGYSGAELVHWLSRHSGVETVLLEHRTDSEARPHPIGVSSPRVIAMKGDTIRAEGIKLAFLATPAEISSELAPAFLKAGVKVVDLSGAYRLETPETFARWYKDEQHRSIHLMAEATYGLPEFYRERIRKASLVANPGCYPTAANLVLRPLMETGVITPNTTVVVDAKSGVSGAGRKPALRTHFSEVTENFSAYSVLEHRHVPEILMNSGIAEGKLSFTAQLIPIDRGILETIYFQAERVASPLELFDVYRRRYSREPFVGLYEPGKVPDVRSAVRTNRCDIGFVFDAATRRVVVVAAIDNLVKGAAGQAIQNMNLMLGFAENMGLETAA
ncbi:MAG: N-acetyl-gamma-glutamyl-phosphate reductase [Bryobacteraceae bacterium]|nr:N-acetyl-gamma-glutamyl-phosphate reductase [Bryobacteraceae bacterium]